MSTPLMPVHAHVSTPVMGRETLCTLQTGPLCVSYLYARLCMFNYMYIHVWVCHISPMCWCICMLKQLFYHMPWDNKICPLIPKAPLISGLQTFMWPTPGTTASQDLCMVLPRTGQTAWGVGLTQEVPPLGIQVGLVGKAAFEHISAIVGAGPGTRDSPAMSTVDQLHDGPRTFWGQRYLENKGSLSHFPPPPAVLVHPVTS